MTTALKAPLAYFGGKRDTAPRIVPFFGVHDIYYDLFAGSLAVLFAKRPVRQEIASDKNADVLNLLRCLADEERAENLHYFTSRMPLSESLFWEAAERLERPFDAPTDDDSTCNGRARDFLLVSWQGPSGFAGTTAKPRFAKRNTASGGSTAARWRAVAGSIPAWHERLQNVEFRAVNAFDLLDVIPDRKGVAIYADPPYHPDARTGGKYVHELTVEQHAELAERLSKFRAARVVVSHRRCPSTDALFPPDRFEPFDLAAPKRMANTKGGSQEVVSAAEVLYVNRPGAAS